MTGLMLMDSKDFIASKDGSIIRGPAADKKVLRDKIKDKVVLVGYNTWKKDISKYPKLIALAQLWLVISNNSFSSRYTNVKSILLTEYKQYNIDYCLGGAETIMTVLPEKLIIHRLEKSELNDGIKLDLSKYKLLISSSRINFIREYYILKDLNEK